MIALDGCSMQLSSQVVQPSNWLLLSVTQLPSDWTVVATATKRPLSMFSCHWHQRHCPGDSVVCLVKSADSCDDCFGGWLLLRPQQSRMLDQSALAQPVTTKIACLVHGAYCDEGSAVGLKRQRLQDRSWPGHRATRSPPMSSVTDSIVQSSATSGTSGSFFATAGDSSYCEGARTSITD